jgi:hypothetical protein
LKSPEKTAGLPLRTRRVVRHGLSQLQVEALEVRGGLQVDRLLQIV